MSQQFIDHMRGVDPLTNHSCDLLIDTNVVIDFLSIADVLRVGDSPLLFGSPSFAYRLSRARHAIVLMWWLNQQGLHAGRLGNETDDLLDKVAPKPSPTEDGVSRALASAIIHVVCELVTGWPVGALTEVDHRLKGTPADTTLLRIAQAEKLAIVTNEEHTERGIVPNRGSCGVERRPPASSAPRRSIWTRTTSTSPQSANGSFCTSPSAFKSPSRAVCSTVA